jgi:SAM-dependent methyltransferase
MEHEANEINSVLYLTEPKQGFEEIYARVRDKEERWLSDDVVKNLPNLPAYHPHQQEWKKRIYSLKKILEILKKSNPIKILEVGCGNGWFANTLVKSGFTIDALDVGKEELEQAARCFQDDNLRFICCDDLSLLDDSAYDVIVFNASLHYFDTSKSFWNLLNSKLQNEGGIFIMDSQFYNEHDIVSAKHRTENYFNQLNEPDAASYYKHLTWGKLPNHKILYSPSKIGRLLNSNQSPFPIIQINKDA